MKKNEPSDAQTTITDLRDAVRRFRDERNWTPYHTPKNLAMSIAIEAAELMEHFQWRTNEESEAYLCNRDAHANVTDELADILIYCLAFVNQVNIDISRAVRSKLDDNKRRFPVHPTHR
jgi:NTP pyrophosphatase (non-canonical NTP hydrolase)